MSGDWRQSDWGLAVEYGRHLFGVFPNHGVQKVTGLLHHEGNIFSSYVASDSWTRYPHWVQEYEETPLKDALEACVRGRDMSTAECSYDGLHYPEQPMESAGLRGHKYEYKRKRAFRQAVLSGAINLGEITVINRYGDVYCIAGHGSDIRDRYWEFIEENYEHRRSHYSATKTQSSKSNS